MGVDSGNFFENQREIELRLMKNTRGTWTVAAPDGGVDRTFDPDDCTVQEIADVLATLIRDLMT